MTIEKLVDILWDCSLEARDFVPDDSEQRARCFIVFVIGALHNMEKEGCSDTNLKKIKSSLKYVIPHLRLKNN